jgi:hypothetical protein
VWCLRRVGASTRCLVLFAGIPGVSTFIGFVVITFGIALVIYYEDKRKKAEALTAHTLLATSPNPQQPPAAAAGSNGYSQLQQPASAAAASGIQIELSAPATASDHESHPANSAAEQRLQDRRQLLTHEPDHDLR